jgi:ankyrin repeat protein
MTRRQWMAGLLAGTLLVGIPSAWFVSTFFRSEFSKPTELHVAAKRNDLETIKTWIAKGRDLDVKYNDPGNIHEGSGVAGQTALMFAAERGHFEAVRALVEGGADIYLETWRPGREGYESSVFDYAIKGGNPRIVKYLWTMSDKRSFKKRSSRNVGLAYTRFCDAQAPPTRAAARELVVFLLDHVANAEVASQALVYISNREQCLDELRFLLDRGVAPTPAALVDAAWLGLDGIVSLYLARGVDVNAAVDHRYVYPGRKITALIAAATAGRRAVVQRLLAAGADPNLQDAAGRTALIAAVASEACTAARPACEERLEVMKALLEHGARTDIRDREGKTALDYANAYAGDAYFARKKAMLEVLD